VDGSAAVDDRAAAIVHAGQLGQRSMLQSGGAAGRNASMLVYRSIA
jgi:hypothetical protein